MVSIIIPAYNYAKYLTDALGSVQQQTYSDWECIIVDDGSIDDTRQIAESFCLNDNRYKYIYQKNQGVSAARNTGIKISKGDFIQFLDGDDLLGEKKLEQQVDIMKNNNIDIVYGRFKYFNEINEINDIKFKNNDDDLLIKISNSGDEIINALIKSNISSVGSFLLRTTIIKRVGYFDESYKSLEDWNYWMRCALELVYFYYDDNKNGVYLIRRGHTSMQSNRDVMISSAIKLRKENISLIKSKRLNKELVYKSKAEYISILSRTLTFDPKILMDYDCVRILIKRFAMKISGFK